MNKINIKKKTTEIAAESTALSKAKKGRTEVLNKITKNTNKVIIMLMMLSVSVNAFIISVFADIYEKDGKAASKLAINAFLGFTYSIAKYMGIGCLAIAIFNFIMAKVNDEPNGLQKAVGFGIAAAGLMALKTIINKAFGLTADYAF